MGAKVSDIYSGREQTEAKHFILRRYLQALAFKVLRFFDIAYVDGFSGPWETRTEDFSDSSFMIAVGVLKDAQQKVFAQTGQRRAVRCFFSEKKPTAFSQLVAAVAPFHKPEAGFEIKTYYGEFEDAISEIQAFIGNSFPLIFVDPTGWTGYPLDKIKPLFDRRKCEVLINFMYDFVNRAASMNDSKTIASLDPILGGQNWEQRLDPNLPRGRAVEKLFRENLRAAGGFEFVVSTKLDRATVDRPHFFIVYGTKSDEGLKAFREVEHAALVSHARERGGAKERKREERSGSRDLFPGVDAELHAATVDDIVEEQKTLASGDLLAALQRFGPMPFSRVCSLLLQAHMLRVTNIKDICLDLAKSGKIENTWGGGNRKPRDDDLILTRAGLRR